MKKNILIIGGCRSGKSRHALKTAEGFSGKKIFIATCIPNDKEMKERVRRHRQERSLDWTTLEVPTLLPEAINNNSQKGNIILVDCLTLWTSNLLAETDNADNVRIKIEQLINSLENARCPIILVSNEVGTGIVPENRLARYFRDMAGFINQQVAAWADSVLWMVAGIPVKIK